jgi:uncharacterized membrane-anchored protein
MRSLQLTRVSWHKVPEIVVLFWAAYVITRPLGASVADWLGKGALGGLGIGDAVVAVVFAVCIAVLVAYLTISRIDVPADQPAVKPDGAEFA